VAVESRLPLSAGGGALDRYGFNAPVLLSAGLIALGASGRIGWTVEA
jgi:hypothetical protein